MDFLRILIVAGLFLSLPTTLRAADVEWLELRPNYTYADSELGCDNSLLPLPVYLVMEVEGSEILRAKLSASRYGGMGSLLLEPSEIALIKGFIGQWNKRWLTHFPLSERIAVWFMYNSDRGSASCQPTAPVESITSELDTFVFDMRAVRGGLSWADSQIIRYQGVLDNGRGFSASLRLRQGI